MWPDWAIFKSSLDKFCYKINKNVWQLFRLLWKNHFLIELQQILFGKLLEKMGYFLLQHLVTLLLDYVLSAIESSVARLGYFWKILDRNVLWKVTQIFDEFLGYFENGTFWAKLLCLILGQLFKHMAIFLLPPMFMLIERDIKMCICNHLISLLSAIITQSLIAPYLPFQPRSQDIRNDLPWPRW